VEKQSNDIVKASVSVLTAALIQDKGFRLSWQASIAAAISEEDTTAPALVDFPHRAANRFLSKLCQTKFEVL